MSIVIGVCGEGTCTLFSDNWSVIPDAGSWMVQADGPEKVIQLNDRLLLSAAGVFDPDEDICGPLQDLEHPESLRLSEASAALIQFMDQDHARLRKYEYRHYILGGVNLRGQLCLFEMRFNPQLGYTEIATHQPDSSHRYTTVLSLPFARQDRQRIWRNRIHYATLNCRTLDELIPAMTQIISDLHGTDRTTGDQVHWRSISLP